MSYADLLLQKLNCKILGSIKLKVKLTNGLTLELLQNFLSFVQGSSSWLDPLEFPGKQYVIIKKQHLRWDFKHSQVNLCCKVIASYVSISTCTSGSAIALLLTSSGSEEGVVELA